jgi:anti-sigma factor RsiW
MNVTCVDRERIFLDGNVEEWAALEVHAATCTECGEEVRVWKNMSSAASELKQEWGTPYLWPKIERLLSEQMEQKPSRVRAWLNSVWWDSSGKQQQRSCCWLW